MSYGRGSDSAYEPRPLGSGWQCCFLTIPKALQGYEELRLRIGEYRLFFVPTHNHGIEIRRICHRREAYR
jgi:hypothetical protein